MKRVYNFQLIVEALNKYTNEKFNYEDDTDDFVSRNFILREDGCYTFEVYRTADDPDTGAINEWCLGYKYTLADAIDAINKEVGNE
jgi:hypothetical protein